mmetsp:Transcript_23275/g.65353  ORF Transcript_23275/g.65353 Transcript_23275/m.65353 type:complete len:95 (+) Transcript_23275:59-343(+)
MPQGKNVKRTDAKLSRRKKALGPGKAITKSKRRPEKRKTRNVVEQCSKEWQKEHMNALHGTVTSKANAKNLHLALLKNSHQGEAKKGKGHKKKA